MKILFFLIVYLINKISSDYEKLDLTYRSQSYYIGLNFPDKEEKSSYLLSTISPKSFFPTSDCSKCKEKIIENPNSTYLNSSKNISIPYYYYNFIGKEYNGTIHAGNYSSEEIFCGIYNFTYLEKYNGRGVFALSFLNYNFSTEKKLFALKFTDEKTELHLGDYDQSNYDIKKANSFFVTIEEKYENYTEQIIHENGTDEYYNDNNIFLENNNYLTEQNDKNDSYIENITIEIDKSRWYINFPSLKIKTDTEMDVDYPNNSYKLTLDLSVDYFFIPKLFFEKNVNKFFPKDSNCQLTQKSGYFVCDCDEDYKTKFGTFVFEANGTKFYVNVTDYMTYQSSITGSVCAVHIVINYDNDMFIGGNSVLNNYYTIFDVENQKLSIIEENNLGGKETKKFLILFFAVLFGSILILFGGYFLYNKYIINEPSGLVPPNNNNDNGNIHQNDNNIEPN